MMLRLLLCSLWLAGSILPARGDSDSTFGVDIAERHIEITAGFNGANVLIFGAISRGQVLLSVEGAHSDYQIRKKNRVNGIWINNESFNIKDLPNFYAFASSDGALESVPRQSMIDERLGFANINTSFQAATKIAASDNIERKIPTKSEKSENGSRAQDFFRSFVDLKQARGMYQYLPNQIDIGTSGLFRINIDLPAEIPPGNYVIRAFSVEENSISQIYQTSLSIRKVGFGAQIYEFAHSYPSLYGLVAIVISVLSGLLANYIFSKRKS